MDYLERLLGLPVTYKSWQHANTMPYYITDLYHIKKVEIGSNDTLFLKPKTELERIDIIKKHITRIRKAEQLPVVLQLPKVSRYRRDALLAAKIPFVVPEKQMYLPFMGVALQERFDYDTPVAEKLQPSAQALLFYYLYQNTEQLYMAQAIDALGYSAMTISRATRQLVQAECLSEEKNGVQKILTSNRERKDLFDEILQLLIDPVRKRIYMNKDQITEEFCLSGDSALARYSMLNEPRVSCYAIDSKRKPKGHERLMDADKQVEVELWKYDPLLLSRDGVVDPLSLVMSLRGNTDERVEEALEDLMDAFWEGTIWSGE